MTDEKGPNKDEKKKKFLQTRDWIIIALSPVTLLLMVAYAKTTAANSDLELQNLKLKNDIQLISVLTSTYIEVQQKEAEVNDQLCEEKLNRGYLEFYEKLQLKSDSVKYFKKAIEEIIQEKQTLASQRDEKAESYNTYAQSLDWDVYGGDLYNLPREMATMQTD